MEWCERGMEACGVPGGVEGRDWECVDTSSDLESCKSLLSFCFREECFGEEVIDVVLCRQVGGALLRLGPKTIWACFSRWAEGRTVRRSRTFRLFRVCMGGVKWRSVGRGTNPQRRATRARKNGRHSLHTRHRPSMVLGLRPMAAPGGRAASELEGVVVVERIVDAGQNVAFVSIFDLSFYVSWTFADNHIVSR
jgi:hypothetical protein